MLTQPHQGATRKPAELAIALLAFALQAVLLAAYLSYSAWLIATTTSGIISLGASLALVTLSPLLAIMLAGILGLAMDSKWGWWTGTIRSLSLVSLAIWGLAVALSHDAGKPSAADLLVMTSLLVLNGIAAGATLAPRTRAWFGITRASAAR